MKEYVLGLQPKYYNLIKAGVKIFEGRLNDEKRRLIEIGDIIVFKKDPERTESFKVKVVDKLFFNSFQEMAEKLDAKEIGFEGQSSDEISDIYKEFYSEDAQRENGVVAIKIKLID